MRRSVWIWLAITAGCVALPAPAGAQASPAAPVFDLAADTSGVPVEIFDRIIYLPVRVNGSAPLTFVLDTGDGSISAIDRSVADSLRLPLRNPSQGGGAGEESVDIFLTDSVGLSLPGVTFPGLTAMVLPLHRMDAQWGKRKDGLIGGDLISTLTIRIDYDRARIRFENPKSFHYAGDGESVPVVIANGFVFLRTELLLYNRPDPVDAFLMLDTGVRITVFNSPYSDINRLAEQSPRTVTGITGYGIGGVSRGTVGRVRGIRIGATTIEDPVVSFSLDRQGALADSNFSGIIGADILGRFNLVFDYQRSRVFFEKNRSFGAPSEFDMSGIRFVQEGSRFETLKVFSVFENSPASDAGLREGDVITSIDGSDAANFTREMLRQYMQQDGKVVRLTIRREGGLRDVRIRLRRMV